MGKITICSLQSDSALFSEMFKNFLVSSQSEDEYGTITSYRKLSINTKNIYRSNDGFAVGCGTFIFNNKTDADALEELFDRFDNDIASLRRDIIGSYCIAIYKNNAVTVFIDEMNTYNLYYYFCKESNRLVITNTYYHIARLLGQEAIIDKTVFACGWMNQLLNENTIFNTIKKFTASTAFVFRNGEWRKESVEVKNGDKMSSVSEYLVSKYSGLSQVFQTSGIGMTGGQDSRLSLALMMAIGMKPTLMYGEGDSLQTCTKHEDHVVMNKISLKFNLPTRKLDWTETNEEQYEEYLDNYGEYVLVYNFNKNIFNEFAKIKDIAFITYGFFGEVYRNIEEIVDYPREQFSARDFILESYSKKALNYIDKRDMENYVAYVEKEIIDICKMKNIDHRHLIKADFQIINTVRRQYSDSALGNLTNMFVYSFPLFGDISATCFAESVDFALRNDSKYQMKMISDLYPELLEVPFFSHIKPKKLNTITFELTDDSMPARIKDKIRPLIKNQHIMYLARKLYYLTKRDFKGISELKKEQIETRNLNKRLYEFCRFDLNRAYTENHGDGTRLKRLILMERLVNSVEERSRNQDD